MVRKGTFLLAVALGLSACTGAPSQDSAGATGQEGTDSSFTLGEAREAIVACLNERGFEATLDPDDGAINVRDLPRDQANSLRSAMADCEQLPGVPRLPAPSTEAEFREIYDGQVEVARCLEEIGFSGDIPSFDVFRESESDWTPYNWLASLPAKDFAEANRECPQFSRIPED